MSFGCSMSRGFLGDLWEHRWVCVLYGKLRYVAFRRIFFGVEVLLRTWIRCVFYSSAAALHVQHQIDLVESLEEFGSRCVLNRTRLCFGGGLRRCSSQKIDQPIAFRSTVETIIFFEKQFLSPGFIKQKHLDGNSTRHMFKVYNTCMSQFSNSRRCLDQKRFLPTLKCIIGLQWCGVL